MPLRVVAAGECMLELVREGSLWRLGAAGDSFNTAVYLHRLGAEARFLTAVGQDPFSEEMLQGWGREGIDISLVLRDPARLPGLYAVRTDLQGERTFHYWRGESAARRLFALAGADTALAAAARCDLLYLTGVTLSLFTAPERARWVELARVVRASGGQVAFDPNYRPRGWASPQDAGAALAAIAPLTDFLLTTDTDDRALWGVTSPQASFALWQGMGAREIVVKQGASGATVGTDAGLVQVPPDAPLEPVDTTGAGDAFNAAYLFARLSGWQAQAAARAGHQLAGQVVQVRGAIAPRAVDQ